MLIGLILLSFSFSFSFERAEILAIGKSGKTFLLNAGHFQGTQFMRITPFYIRSKSGRFINWGKAVPIKTLGSYSLWIKEGDSKIDVEKGDAVFFEIPDYLAFGKPKVTRRKLVFLKGDTPTLPIVNVKDNIINSISPEFRHQEHEVEVSDVIEPHELYPVEDSQVIDLAQWDDKVERGGEFTVRDKKDFYAKVVSKGPKVGNVVKNEISESADLRLQHFLKSLDVEIGVKRKYNTNVFGEYQDRVEREKRRSLKSYDWLSKQKGDWSDTLTDQNLKHFLEEKGIQFERERRFRLGQTVVSHEFFGHILWPYKNSGEQSDLNNPTQGSSGVLLGYELDLYRWLPRIENYSLALMLTSEKGNYSYNAGNITYTQSSFDLFGHYYIKFPVSTVRRLLPFVGIGVGAGTSSLTFVSEDDALIYSYLSFPQFVLGLKYRPNNYFGFQLIWRQRNISLSSTEEVDGFPDELNQRETRLGIGMSLYI